MIKVIIKRLGRVKGKLTQLASQFYREKFANAGLNNYCFVSKHYMMPFFAYYLFALIILDLNVKMKNNKCKNYVGCT